MHDLFQQQKCVQVVIIWNMACPWSAKNLLTCCSGFYLKDSAPIFLHFYIFWPPISFPALQQVLSDPIVSYKLRSAGVAEGITIPETS